MLSERVEAAAALCVRAFRDKVRKGTRVPYVAHLWQVAAWVAEWGGSEDQIIAALLHDYLEDVDGACEAELQRLFGQHVALLVVALSDATSRPKPPWKPRKENYLARLRGETAEVRLVAACDKLHNASGLLRDVREDGDPTWARFHASKEESLWYYRTAVGALADGWAHPLVDELRGVVRELHEASGVPWPQ